MGLLSSAGPTIKVAFLADAAGLKGAGKDVENATGGMRSALGKVGVAVGAAFVADKVVKFATDSIHAAQDLNANMSRTRTIFGDASKGVEDWSKTAATSLRMSQSEALGAANALGKTLVGSFGMSGQAAAGMSEGVVKLAKDMSVFNRVPFDEALQKVTAGLNGQTKGLKTLGVNMDQAEIKAKALQMGLLKQGEALTPANKAQATYALLLEKTQLQQGATAKSAGSLKAQQEVLTAKWTDAKAQLGNALLPSLTQLVTALSSGLVPVITVVGTLFDRFGAVLVPLVVGILAAVVAIKLVTAAQILFNIALSANVIGIIIISVIAFVAVLMILAAHFDQIKGAVETAFGAVLKAFQVPFNWIKSNWPLLLGILLGPIGIAVALIITHFDSIRNGITGIFNWIKSNWPLLVAILSGPIGIAVLAIVRNFDSIKGAISAALSGLENVILAPFLAAKHMVESLVIAPIKSAWNAIAHAINAVHFKLPEIHIPLGPTLGGETIGFPKLPVLGRGAVVDRMTLAYLGERGRELVAPEPLLREIVRTESGGTRGPAVVVEHVELAETVDIDVFMDRVAWLARARSL